MCNDLISFKTIKCVKVQVHSLGALTQCHGTIGLSQGQWNPIDDKEEDALSTTASVRIKRDLVTFFNDPPPGLYAVTDGNNLKFIHAIVTGVANTPYEGGFFYFVLKCPNDYPFRPPKVKLMTTDVENVQFGSNFYRTGKVYLSILGTCEGPAWCPTQQITDLLLAIQSLMVQNPYFSESFVFEENISGDFTQYNDLIRYQTLRVAICGMLESDRFNQMPLQLREIMEKLFLENYERYVEIASMNTSHDGLILTDPFTKLKYEINYTDLLLRLERLYKRINEKYATAEEAAENSKLLLVDVLE